LSKVHITVHRRSTFNSETHPTSAAKTSRQVILHRLLK